MADGTVVIGSFDNTVYGLTASGGSVRRQYDAGAGVWSSPVVADGLFYCANTDGTLRAVEPVDAELRGDWPMFGSNAPNTAHRSVHIERG